MRSECCFVRYNFILLPLLFCSNPEVHFSLSPSVRRVIQQKNQLEIPSYVFKYQAYIFTVFLLAKGKSCESVHYTCFPKSALFSCPWRGKVVRPGFVKMLPLRVIFDCVEEHSTFVGFSRNTKHAQVCKFYVQRAECRLFVEHFFQVMNTRE